MSTALFFLPVSGCFVGLQEIPAALGPAVAPSTPHGGRQRWLPCFSLGGRFGQVSTGVPDTKLQSYQEHQPGKERGSDGKRLFPLGAMVLIPSLPVPPAL